MGSYLGTLHVPATAGSLLVALGGVHWTVGAVELNQGLYVGEGEGPVLCWIPLQDCGCWSSAPGCCCPQLGCPL